MIPTLPLTLDHYYFENIKIIANPKYDFDDDEINGDPIDLDMDFFITEDESMIEYILKLNVAKSASDFKVLPYRISAEFHAWFTLPYLQEEEAEDLEKGARAFVDGFSISYSALRDALFQATLTCANGEFMLPILNVFEYLKSNPKLNQFN